MGLAPAGPRSGPEISNRILSDIVCSPIYDCYAAERGQAPSPQDCAWHPSRSVLVVNLSLTSPSQTLLIVFLDISKRNFPL